MTFEVFFQTSKVFNVESFRLKRRVSCFIKAKIRSYQLRIFAFLRKLIRNFNSVNSTLDLFGLWKACENPLLTLLKFLLHPLIAIRFQNKIAVQVGVEFNSSVLHLVSLVSLYNPNCLGNHSVISGNSIIKIKARIIAKKNGRSGLITF